MKTLLTLAALITAVATPVSFVLEAQGITLPSLLSSSSLFGTFVAIGTVLMMVADYRGTKTVRCESTDRKIVSGSRTELPLAA